MTVVLALVVGLVGPAVPSAAFHPDGIHWVACADPADSDCIVSVRIGTANGAGGTAPGTAPYGDVIADVYTVDFVGTVTSLGHIQVELRNPDYELDPTVSTSTEITVVLRFGFTFEPAVVIGTGDLSNWTWDVTTRELTVIGFPRASSWADVCFPGNCPDSAIFDHTSMFLIAIDDTKFGCCVTPFNVAYVGGYVATNAQYFALPFVNPFTMAIEFELGAPHFKSDGATVNTGSFKILIPDPVITNEWGMDPATLSVAALSVTVGGAAAGFSMTRVTGRAPLADGWLIESAAPITFSTPTVAIAPASASAIVVDEPFVPVTVPESADAEGAGPLDLGSIVRLGPSGTVGVPLTLSGVGAALGIAAGTKLTTSAGTFAGDIVPPFHVEDPTGGKVAGVTALIAGGMPVGVSEVTLSQAATLTLPVPPGATASRYQPVEVDRLGRITYRSGRVVDAGVQLAVDRLGSASIPWQRAYGLVEIPAPAARHFTPSATGLSGHHSRWAGQSAAVELAAGQLADLTVRLLNAGTEPWVRGVLGRQANLGSNPVGSTTAVDDGLVLPLWGRDRFATTSEAEVKPGEYGTFTLRVRAPTTPGVYRIDTRPVVEGAAWLEDQGIYLEIAVH